MLNSHRMEVVVDVQQTINVSQKTSFCTVERKVTLGRSLSQELRVGVPY